MKRATALACTVLAGMLGSTDTALARGGEEFEAVILDGVPLPFGSSVNSGSAAVNESGQIAFPNANDQYALVFIEVDGDEFSWTEFVDPIRPHASVAMNAAGTMAVRMGNLPGGIGGGYSIWTPEGVQTIISTSTGYAGDPPGITGDGTVAWNFNGTTFAWTSDDGVAVIGALSEPCATTKTVMATPGGRLAVKNSVGFFCLGGIGYTTWANAQANPQDTTGILNVSCTSMYGITDSGKLLAFGQDFGSPCQGSTLRLYDTATGSYAPLPGLFTDFFDLPLFINNDEWVATTSGLLHRDGVIEDLASLVSGIDNVSIHAMAENGHFLGETLIDGEPVMVLIRPAGDDPGSGPDLDGDGDVDLEDLLLVLAAWGPAVGNPADLNGDGFVGFADLVILLAQWGQP